MQRAASRYLLPLELLLGALSIALAFAGGVFHGYLYRALLARDEVGFWFAPFFLWGTVQMFISGHEWLHLRYATEKVILDAVSARCFLAFMGVLTWLGALYVVLFRGLALEIMYITLVCPLAIVFHAWSFYENLKVRNALNPKVSTPWLRFHR